MNGVEQSLRAQWCVPKLRRHLNILVGNVKRVYFSITRIVFVAD
jgi:hypothetical protein